MGSTDVGNPCSVCCCFLFGMCVLFPFALVFTGWNEQVAVCRAWAIDGAEQKAVALDCAQHTTDALGGALTPGTLGFLSCGVNSSTFKTFSGNDFTGLSSLTNLFDPAGSSAAAMTMSVKSWQCEETCSRSECHRRLEEVSSDGKATVDESKGRRLLSRRLTGEPAKERNLKSKSKSCNSQCVEWSHQRVLEGTVLSTSFEDRYGAERVCGTIVNPQPVKIGTSDFHASAGQVSTLPGNAWALNDKQIKSLPIELGVALSPRAASGTVSSATTAPAQLDEYNTYVQGNVLKTCTGTNMGCLEITFLKAAPARATMLGAVSSMYGQMNVTGWEESEYWVCKGSHANNINRFCPSTPLADANDALHKGSMACGEDVTTMPQLFTIMKDANSEKQWMFRAIGFCCFWFAISCCLQPIESALGFITNMMDDGTDCIPCVGSAVDCLTDIFMGMVKAILCVVSCCCAVGWFLSVVVVMWFVMRPMMGMALAVVACCFCTGAGGLLYYFRGSGGKDSSRYDEEEEMSDMEYDNE